MNFTEKQLQILKEEFARERMKESLNQESKVRRPRIIKHHYEKITSHNEVTTIITSKPYIRIFDKKMFVSQTEITLYIESGFEIHY